MTPSTKGSVRASPTAASSGDNVYKQVHEQHEHLF